MKFIFYMIIFLTFSGCGTGNSNAQSGTVTVSCICLPDIGHHTDLFSKPINGVGATRAEAIKDARNVCDKYAQYNTLSCN